MKCITDRKKSDHHLKEIRHYILTSWDARNDRPSFEHDGKMSSRNPINDPESINLLKSKEPSTVA